MTEFYKVIKAVEDKFGKGEAGSPAIDEKFNEDMDEDFNTALALSELFGLFKKISAKLAANDKTAADDVLQIRKTYSLLGLFKKNADDYLKEVAAKNPENGAELPAEVAALAEKRWTAKLSKSWAEADALRAEIDKLGYTVKDGKDGYTVSKK